MQIKRFDFTRTFELEGTEVAAELGEDLLAEIVTLRATIAQMEARQADALQEARSEGFAVGRAHAGDETSTTLLAATDALHAALEELDMRMSNQLQSVCRDAAELAFLAAEILAGHAIDFAPARAVDEALDRALAQVARGTGLVIRVHPTLAPTMEERLAERIAKERRKLDLTLVPDETLAPGDGLIAWNEGALAVDSAARRAALLAELAPLMGGQATPAKDSGTANIAAHSIL